MHNWLSEFFSDRRLMQQAAVTVVVAGAIIVSMIAISAFINGGGIGLDDGYKPIGDRVHIPEAPPVNRGTMPGR